MSKEEMEEIKDKIDGAATFTVAMVAFLLGHLWIGMFFLVFPVGVKMLNAAINEWRKQTQMVVTQ